MVAKSSGQVRRYQDFIQPRLDTYFPRFYYCSITSAGSNFTCMSHLENQLYYHPLTLKIFEDFYHRLIGIPKDDKIKMLLHLGFP